MTTITITRRLAAQLKTVCRRALHLTARGVLPTIMIGASPAGLQIRCRTAEATVAYSTTDDPPEATLCVPFQLLSDCEGSREDPATLHVSQGRVVARWFDNGVPQVAQHDVAKPTWNDWPTAPKRFATNPPGFLQALDDACATSDAGSARYALGCVQLQGGAGKLVATDGRQLLVQDGFEFPWKGDVLVPASKVYAAKQLSRDEPVLVGRSKDWFCLRAGCWTVQFAINHDGRFPNAEDNIPRPEAAIGGFRISEPDRKFLIGHLSGLPDYDPTNHPVTIDLNGHVAVRAKDGNQGDVTELVLTGSRRNGEPIRLNTNRQYLARAARLGFADFHVAGSDSPMLGTDGNRSYVWALLGSSEAIKPQPNAVRIESKSKASRATCSSQRVTPSPQPSTRRERPSMAKPNQTTNDRPQSERAVEQPSLSELIDNGEQLRSSLRDALSHTTKLLAGLKTQRQKSKRIRSAMLSLRQLQAIDA